MFIGLYLLLRYDFMIGNSPLSIYRVTGLNTYFERGILKGFKNDELYVIL